MASVKCMIFVVICLIAMMAPLISAHGCPSTNNARCSVWKQGGFCTSNYYTIEKRQKECGTECGLCCGANPC